MKHGWNLIRTAYDVARWTGYDDVTDFAVEVGRKEEGMKEWREELQWSVWDAIDREQKS